MRHWWLPISLVYVCCVGCGSNGGDVADAGPRDDGAPSDLADAGVPDSGPDTGIPGPTGFIGSPCKTAQDCQFSNASCLTQGFPAGTCSQACVQYCPDQSGHPITFCVDAADLPPTAPSPGACFSRCDFGLFPDTGCRHGYACLRVHQATSGAENYACLPGQASDLSLCHFDLADTGLGFEPTVVPDTHPDPPNESLTCKVQDPVYLFFPLRGVEMTMSGKALNRLIVSCAAAKAVAATVDDLKTQGVVSIQTMGTLNCRVIAGTNTLSRHAYGDAIDIAAVTLGDGTVYSLLNDWEHDTSAPQTPGGILLYEAAHRWYNTYIWNIILTPNYNVAHDDHFHVDLTPSSHFIKIMQGRCPDGRYIGPAPYAD